LEVWKKLSAGEVGLVGDIEVAKYFGPRASPIRPGSFTLQPNDCFFDQVRVVACEGLENAVDEGFVVTATGFADERCGGGTLAQDRERVAGNFVDQCGRDAIGIDRFAEEAADGRAGCEETSKKNASKKFPEIDPIRAPASR
jgi:hypothetical protein